MTGDLAFNINYPVVEISCKEAECSRPWPCGAMHRRHTGEATLTVVGSIQRIQQIASEIIPGWPVTSEAPPPAAQGLTCVACGASSKDVAIELSSTRCSECVRNGWTPLQPSPSPMLTSRELDAMKPGDRVSAGGFADGARNERHEWWKLMDGRWDSRSSYGCSIDGKDGVSSIWLAHNREPKRLT